MTAIRHLTGESDEAWNAFVTAHPAGTCCHLTEWGAIAQTLFGWGPHYLLAEADGNISGVLPLVHVRTLFGRSALVSTPFCVYGGALAVDEITAERLEESAAALARELEVDYLELRQRDRSHERWTGSDLYCTFRKPLDPDPERNRAAIPRKQRAMIRKGEKTGLTASRGRDVDTFYDLFCAGMRNLGTPVYPRRLFSELEQRFGDRCDILVVEHEGVPVSAVLSLYFRNEVLPYYAGGTTEARRLAAFDFMYWKLMEHATLAGATVFDFGRSMRGTGSFAFKKNWGFEPQALEYQFDMIHGHALPVVDPDKFAYRWLAAAWRRLPLPLANAIGPVVSRALY